MGRMTTILVPKELRDKINLLARKDGKAAWRVVEEAISFIYTEKAKPIVKESLSWVEKVSWYTAK